ncbi:MAG: hypothetical protein VB050_03785 [Geobacteraceae bacterium]|nr:hypothetical protein [Geobacteraceae bacterium]
MSGYTKDIVTGKGIPDDDSKSYPGRQLLVITSQGEEMLDRFMSENT